jgi:hypothetical protein
VLRNLSVAEAAVSKCVLILINSEFCREWKEADIAKFRVLSRKFLDGTRETSAFNKPQ